jgi:hypothetical protein
VLTYVGDTYRELPYSNTQTENEYDESDYQLDNQDEELESEVPYTVKQQIHNYFQNFYENWVTMKIPSLGNLTRTYKRLPVRVENALSTKNTNVS